MTPEQIAAMEDRYAKKALRLVLLRDLFSTGNHYHVRMLENQLGVSVRTIQRDLGLVSRWLLPLESLRPGWYRRIDFDARQSSLPSVQPAQGLLE